MRCGRVERGSVLRGVGGRDGFVLSRGSIRFLWLASFVPSGIVRGNIVDEYFQHLNFDFEFFLCWIIVRLGRVGFGRRIVFRRGFGFLFVRFWRVGRNGLDNGLGVSPRPRELCSMQFVWTRGIRRVL